MKRKKMLLSTIPVEDIVLTARAHRRTPTLRSIDECFMAGNNIEYVNGFTLPNYATRFIKANVPSVDILEYPTWDEYESALKSERYDVLGISFWTYTSGAAAKMAKMAREAGIPEVWGGGHGVSTPGIDAHFDRVFDSYSEYELKLLLEGEEITEFRHPDLSHKYDYFLEEVPTGYLFAIRGCRAPCNFCSGPRYYKKLAATPLPEVEKILDFYRERGIKHITVVDETFLQRKQHAKEVIEAMEKREMTFTCTSRIDVLVRNIDELHEHGLTNVYVGIESMNPVSLQNVRKGNTPNKTTALLKRLHELGCFAFGTYMICMDNDTEESVKEDVAKLDMFPALYGAIFWITTPFPGTDLYDEVDAAGRIVDKDWSHYTALHLVQEHPNFTPEEARKLLYYCVKNHCHPMNLRKEKLVRRWNKIERRNPNIVNQWATPYKPDTKPWVDPPMDWEPLVGKQPIQHHPPQGLVQLGIGRRSMAVR
ncbi:MAG: radical SAM protein [Proteobacteria bacterium]|nr:radical SAM protein [Pseudomonadota bacterium]